MVHRRTILYIDWQALTSCGLTFPAHTKTHTNTHTRTLNTFKEHPFCILGRQEVGIIRDGDFWLPLESCLMIAGDKGAIIFPAPLPIPNCFLSGTCVLQHHIRLIYSTFSLTGEKAVICSVRGQDEISWHNFLIFWKFMDLLCQKGTFHCS